MENTGLYKPAISKKWVVCYVYLEACFFFMIKLKQNMEQAIITAHSYLFFFFFMMCFFIFEWWCVDNARVLLEATLQASMPGHGDAQKGMHKALIWAYAPWLWKNPWGQMPNSELFALKQKTHS